jgi:hypothetical protein
MYQQEGERVIPFPFLFASYIRFPLPLPAKLAGTLPF